MNIESVQNTNNTVANSKGRTSGDTNQDPGTAVNVNQPKALPIINNNTATTTSQKPHTTTNNNIPSPTAIDASLKQSRSSAAPRLGPYLMGKTLGQGASGRVKLGTHVITSERVAVKIIPKTPNKQKSEEENAQRLQKLEREIAIMKLIRHPHILCLHDVYESVDELFLVMELVEGGELFDYLIKRKRLDENEALDKFQQIISAVDFCHKHLISHRDLKLENILLDGNGRIKVADFGMASIQANGKLLETSCGSPHYASPEVIRGVKYEGEATDVWSCGVILYALLAGCLPFDDENTRRLLQKVKSGVFTMHNAIPQGPADLIKRMLVINPADRITLDEIKRHPWFQKRKFLLDNGAGPLSNPPSPAALQPYTQHTLANVDEEILQNLSLLGYGSQDDIIRALCTPEPNYEKVFYWLLDQKKTEQLENFDPHIDAALGQQQQCEDDGGKTPRKRVSSRSSIGSARALSVYCTPNGSQMDLNLASPLSPKSPRDTFIVSPGASNGSSTEINVKRMTTEGSRVRPVNPSPLAVHLPTVNSNNSSATGTNNNNVNAVAEKLQRLQMNNINTGQQQQPNYEVTQSLPSLNSTNANSANSVSNSSAEEAPKSPKKRFDLFSKLRASVGSVKTNTASASDVSKDDSGLNSPVMSNSNIPKTSWFDTLLKFKPGTFQFSRKESTSVSRSLVVQTLAAAGVVYQDSSEDHSAIKCRYQSPDIQTTVKFRVVFEANSAGMTVVTFTQQQGALSAFNQICEKFKDFATI